VIVNQRKENNMAQNPAIVKYVNDVNAYLDRADSAMDGIKGDVTAIKAELEKIQNSPGTLSPEDQASLDAALQRMGTLTQRIETLDQETAPAVPQVPTVE
jgi:uncharacterized protein YoxC